MLWQMALVFAVLSALGFGGGNAVFPQLYADSVDVHHWVTGAQFTSDFALARLSPGPATGIASLIGFRVGSLWGAVIGAFAMFVPAALVVFVIAHLYDRFNEHPWRALFARAMIPIVLGLSWVGVIFLGRGALENSTTWILGAISAGVILFTRVNASLVIVLAGIVGVVFLR
jgi:chromate transporter